jgi:hypothetical protein
MHVYPTQHLNAGLTRIARYLVIHKKATSLDFFQIMRAIAACQATQTILDRLDRAA